VKCAQTEDFNFLLHQGVCKTGKWMHAAYKFEPLPLITLEIKSL